MSSMAAMGPRSMFTFLMVTKLLDDGFGHIEVAAVVVGMSGGG